MSNTMITLSACLHRIAGKRRAILDYVGSTGSLGIGLVAQTIAFIVLARTLGTEQYGLLTIVMTVASLGLMWCGLGSGEMMRRRVARRREDYPAALGHAVVVLAATSTAIALPTAAVLAAWVPISPDPYWNFIIILALVASNQGLTAWISLTEKVYLSHDHFQGANLVNVLSGLARALIVVIACIVFGVTDLAGWAFWQLGCHVVIAIACGVAILPYGAPRLGIMKEELVNGATISFSSLLVVMRYNVDVLALSIVAPPSVVGVYGVCRRIIATASIVSHSFDRLVYSSLAIAGEKGPSATFALAARYAIYVTGLCLASSVLLYFASPLAPLLFGQSYADTASMLAVMCWLLTLTGLQHLASDALNAADRHKTRLATEGVFSVLGAAIVAAMTIQFGITGMLMSLFVSSGLVVAALWASLWHAGKQDPNGAIAGVGRELT